MCQSSGKYKNKEEELHFLTSKLFIFCSIFIFYYVWRLIRVYLDVQGVHTNFVCRPFFISYSQGAFGVVIFYFCKLALHFWLVLRFRELRISGAFYKFLEKSAENSQFMGKISTESTRKDWKTLKRTENGFSVVIFPLDQFWPQEILHVSILSNRKTSNCPSQQTVMWVLCQLFFTNIFPKGLYFT